MLIIRFQDRSDERNEAIKIIFKLSLLGWTLGEIAKVTGIQKSQIANISNNGEIAKPLLSFF